MLGRLRAQMTYANVMATIAVFIALGGTSYAALALGRNSVKSRHIGPAQVKRADIATGAVTTSKVADSSLTALDFKPNQLPATRLAVRAARGTDRVTAHCESGERATGGGAHSVGGIVVGHGPTPEPLAFYAPPDQPLASANYVPTAWSAAAETETGSTDVTAWVVCAKP